MSVPGWWASLLLALAAFRTYRLLAKDVILDQIRSRIVGLHGWKEGKPVPASYRQGLGEFIVCPWCLGFWVSIGWWGAWQLWPNGALVVAVPFAISAVVGLVAQLDKED
jgi:hypothetical protein